jgi:phytoene dehydrogenase-like protein
MNDNSVIIIGGGIAGLAAGVYAQMNGYKSSIFEMHTLPGGLCTSWQRKGYTFDGCIHWLVGTNPKSGSHVMWEELGALKDVDIVDHEAFITVENTDGKLFHMYADIDRLEKHMLELAPEDTAVIKEFCGAIRKLGSLDMPMDDAKGLGARIRGMFSLLPMITISMKYGKTNVTDFSTRFKNPFMRTIWASMFDLPDFPLIGLITTMAWQNKKDAGYPIGGSLPFSKTIEKRYKDLGGEIHYNARVEKILVENDQAVGILLTDGQVFRAGRVISAADGFATINHMLGGKYSDPELKEYYDKGEIFEPLVMVSLGVNRDMSDQPHVKVKMLDKPITIAGEERNFVQVKHYGYDPTLAPKGKTVVMAMFSTKHDYWKKLAEDPEHYDAEKKQAALAVISTIDQYLPGFEKDVEVVDVATPLTTERYTGNWQGSFEGWRLTTKNMSKVFTGGLPHTLQGLKNFYMVGQWVEPGGGLPTAGVSGRNMIKRICKEDGKPFTTSRK